jgi:hypothetical protein
VDLFTVDFNVWRGSDPNADPVAFDGYDGNSNATTHHDALIQTPSENQHALSSLHELGDARGKFCAGGHQPLLITVLQCDTIGPFACACDKQNTRTGRNLIASDGKWPDKDRYEPPGHRAA